jgi:hypothetical protein
MTRDAKITGDKIAGATGDGKLSASLIVAGLPPSSVAGKL